MDLARAIFRRRVSLAMLAEESMNLGGALFPFMIDMNNDEYGLRQHAQDVAAARPDALFVSQYLSACRQSARQEERFPRGELAGRNEVVGR